jgi:hypothetical protein
MRIIMVGFLVCFYQANLYAAQQMHCDVYDHGKKVLSKDISYRASSITGTWGKQNPGTYYARQYREGLCKSAGLYQQNKAVGYDGKEVAVYNSTSASPSCTVTCEASNPYAKKTSQENSQGQQDQQEQQRTPNDLEKAWLGTPSSDK